MARERSPPLLKCLAIWFRLDPIFPYCARSDLTSSLSITIWYFGVSFLFKITFRMKSDLVILHFSARSSNTDSSISVNRRQMMCVRSCSLFFLIFFILLLPLRDKWSRQQRCHSLKCRLSLPDRFQCCAQHSVGSQYNSEGNGIPIKSPTTENAKVRKSAFVLRGGSCSLKIHTLSLIERKRASFTVRTVKNLILYFNSHLVCQK